MSRTVSKVSGPASARVGSRNLRLVTRSRHRRPRLVDLSGAWRVHASDGDLARRFTDPSISDADWPEVPVPGHWQSTEAFAGERRADAVPPVVRRGHRSSPATVAS